LLFDETASRGRSRKLSAQWVGPYTITELDKVNATIVKGRKPVSTRQPVKTILLDGLRK